MWAHPLTIIQIPPNITRTIGPYAEGGRLSSRRWFHRPGGDAGRWGQAGRLLDAPTHHIFVSRLGFGNASAISSVVIYANEERLGILAGR
ncbi:MAG TPA: hypothetical protein VN774_07820 [Candidatus Limnocylindrales bacterium]|nr:hypothetical protein [Candidatus Limnocylindrales bacterium]